jgi:membrane fusion protein (multidrug efflux system)
LRPFHHPKDDQVADMSRELEPAAESEARGPQAAGGEAEAPAAARRSRLRLPLLLAAPILVLVGALYFYLTGGRYEATDNAYLQSGQVGVTASVGGQVIAVLVHENETVKAGQILFRLDPAPYQALVDEAQAQLADARTQIGEKRANYRAGQSEVQSAQAKLAYATREAARQKALLAEGISSQNQYDQAVLAVRTARDAIQTATQQAASVAAGLSGNVGAPDAAQPAVAKAQAALARARLNLGYTIVRAAQDGIVAKVSQLQVGDYVTAAKPVFTLVGRHIWVEANFKENQLRYMRLGQRATIKIDAFPDGRLPAHLASFSPGTGNAFSLLPAENATGNWVKVVQRLPVELDLDRLPPGVPLHAGLSVEVSVDTGHERHLFGPDTPPVQPAPRPGAPARAQ